MANTKIKQLENDKDIACYGVMGCARAFLNMHKSGLPLQCLPWETLEKCIGKFEALEKELKSALSDEEAA